MAPTKLHILATPTAIELFPVHFIKKRLICPLHYYLYMYYLYIFQPNGKLHCNKHAGPLKVKDIYIRRCNICPRKHISHLIIFFFLTHSYSHSLSLDLTLLLSFSCSHFSHLHTLSTLLRSATLKSAGGEREIGRDGRRGGKGWGG